MAVGRESDHCFAILQPPALLEKKMWVNSSRFGSLTVVKSPLKTDENS
jgi:hypothetical protein